MENSGGNIERRNIASLAPESNDSDSSYSDDASEGYSIAIETVMESTSESSGDEVASHVTVLDFVETINEYSDDDFKAHLRVNRSTANLIIDGYSTSEFVVETTGGRRKRVGAIKQVYIYLWYVANTVTFRQISNLFGISKSAAWNAVHKVTKWLISIGHQYITWPQGSKVIEVAAKFEARRKMPGIIGAIDCTHITIKAPTANKQDFFDRKRNYSIVLQAVVDADKNFTDVFVGEAGSLHDSRVLRRSDLYQRATTNPALMFPGETFIIGDSAYSSNSWLVAPFKNFGSLSDAQIQFNFLHSSARMVVENTFGLLKNRFRRLLHFTEQANLSTIVNIVMSICILHNICNKNDDGVYEQEEPNEVSESEHGTRDDCSDRRQKLFDLLVHREIIRN